MRILIDTNCYSAVDNGDAEAVSRVQSATEVWIPLIVSVTTPVLNWEAKGEK